jgi:hypothetical protein
MKGEVDDVGGADIIVHDVPLLALPPADVAAASATPGEVGDVGGAEPSHAS